MGLKPETARWFELLTPSDSLAAAVEALAKSGSVQIETHGRAPSLDTFRDLRPGLEAYEKLWKRYGPYLPKEGLRASVGGVPEQVLAQSMARLQTWASDAEPVIRTLQALERDRDELLLMRELLESGGSLAALDRTGPTLRGLIAVLPAGAPAVELPDAVLDQRIEGPKHVFLAVLGAPELMDQALAVLAALDAKILEPRGERAPAERLLEVTRAIDEQKLALERAWEAHDIRRAVANVRRLCWFVRSVPRFPHTANFSIVTGWSDDATGDRMRAALEHEGVSALLRFPAPPEGVDPPVILHNPGWARPFEKFAALLGTPSRNESDPSVVLALVVPLLFGYMFGDVGHGLTLVVVGLLLRRRFPIVAMLVPAGISSAIFGVVFGCVFTLEGVIPPLWVHPLSDPLALLLGSLVIGAAVLLIGILLSALGVVWRRKLPIGELSLLLVFGGALALLVVPCAWMPIVAGFSLFAAAQAIEASAHRGRAAVSALGELLERTLQLGVNTLSFARVGAFALAHAGLSAAVVTLSNASQHLPTKIIILLIGNVFVLAIEGLVVSIQTTRLVLFEFFARFLRGEGRVFRPLAPPAESSA